MEWLPKADPEIAAAIFSNHLDELWSTGRPARLGWGLLRLGPLDVVTALPGERADGSRDWFFIRLGAEHYDTYPVTVRFVTPVDWTDAGEGTRWLPSFSGSPPFSFALHPQFANYPDRVLRQLVCFSYAAEYYVTGHSPQSHEAWQQGKHTVAGTLYRLAEVLRAPFYMRPAG